MYLLSLENSKFKSLLLRLQLAKGRKVGNGRPEICSQ